MIGYAWFLASWVGWAFLISLSDLVWRDPSSYWVRVGWVAILGGTLWATKIWILK